MGDVTPEWARHGGRPSPVPRSRVRFTACVALGAGEDAEVAVALKQMAAHLVVPGLAELEVDMSGLTRCGPEILGAVRELSGQLGERGVALSIRGPVPDVVIEALDDESLPDLFVLSTILRRATGPSGRTEHPV